MVDLGKYETEFEGNPEISLSGADLSDAEAGSQQIRFEPAELKDCTPEQVLAHPKTAQIVRLFDKHMRKNHNHEGPVISVESLQRSNEHHGKLLEFVQRLPVAESPLTAMRRLRIAHDTLQRVQLIAAYKAECEEATQEPDQATIDSEMQCGFDDAVLSVSLDS